MLALRQRKYMPPDGKLTAKIKPTPRRPTQSLGKLRLTHRIDGKVRPRQGGGHDLLPRNPQRLREHRAQALVPRNQIAQRPLQRRKVQLPFKPHRQRDRVGRPRTLQTMQKPQPPLRIGQRNLATPLRRTQRRTRRLPLPTQPLAEPGYARRLEQAADRNLDRKNRADAADQPRRQKRMTPQRKKVVV